MGRICLTLLLSAPALCMAQDNSPTPTDTFLNFLRPVIGAGFTVRDADFVDFKTENGRLLTVNDSRFRVSATAGFWVPWSTCGIKWERQLRAEPLDPAQGPTLPACYPAAGGHFRRWRMRSGFLFNLQFTQGGQSTVDGFTAGYGFMVRPGVILHAGYTRAKGQELSAGFRRSAAQLIASPPPGAEGELRLWTGQVNADQSGLVNEKLWDGFPLTVATKPVFAGANPIVDSYNGSVSFGVAIPLDLLLRTAAR